MKRLATSAQLFIDSRKSDRYTPATVENYEKFFSLMLPFFEDKELTIQTWREFMETKKERKNSTKNHYNKCIKAFMNWMVTEEIIAEKENFCKKLGDPLPTEERKNIPSRATARLIVDSIGLRQYTCHARISKKEIDEEYIPAIKLIFNTGIRNGSIGSILGSDILTNVEYPKFYYRDKGGKMGKKIWQNIPVECLEDMKRRSLRGDKPAFKFTNPKYKDEINKLLKESEKLLGLPKTTCHYLRHSYATYVANETPTKIHDLQRLLGHKNISTTMKYIHEDEKHLAEVVRNAIDIEHPELLKQFDWRESVIAILVANGVARWRIACSEDGNIGGINLSR